MSLQKEIKYAINSTVGTSAFEPLSDMVNSDIRFEASKDKIYYNFGYGPISKKFKSFGTGSIIVSAKVQQKGSPNGQITVLKNGSIYGTATYGGGDSLNYHYATVYVNDILYGDEIEIIFDKTQGTTGSPEGVVRICAEQKIKSDSLIKIET